MVASSPRKTRSRFTSASLLVQNEYALLSRKAQFQHFAVCIRKNFCVFGFGVAVFPAAIRFGDGLFPIREDEVVSIDSGAVITGLHVDLPYLHLMGDRKALGYWFCKCAHRNCQRGGEY